MANANQMGYPINNGIPINFNGGTSYQTFGYPQNLVNQVPYNNVNNLLSNSPYDNYMRGQQLVQQGGQEASIQNQINQFLKCRPVSSKEEARAFQIDLDGSLWVFTDLGNEKIYTKQINADGTASFKTYAFVAETENTYNPTEFVTKEELNKVVQSLMAAMQVSSPQQAMANSGETPAESATLLNFN